MGREIVLTDNGEAQFKEARGNGTSAVTVKANATLAADIDFILPVALPSATEALTITSAGQLATSAGSQSYGAIYNYTLGGAGAQTLTDASTWYQISAFSANGVSSGVTPDHTNDHITIATTGVYQVSFNISFSGTLSETFEVSAWKNDGATQMLDVAVVRKLGTGGDVGSAAAGSIVSLAATNTVELWAQCTSGAAKDINPHAVSLSVHRIA